MFLDKEQNIVPLISEPSLNAASIHGKKSVNANSASGMHQNMVYTRQVT